MATSPTQRTLDRLREEGWMVAIVEHWNPHAKIRQDLFGFADIIAVKPFLLRGLTLAVQATTTSNLQARVKKLRGMEAVEECKRAGWIVQCWGWTKYAKAVDRKFWRPTIIAM